jgi:nucleotide-binding universal stress UspA family protein
MQKKIQNILAATDFSDLGANAIRVAVKLCKQNNAVLHLIHVVEKRYIIPGTDSGTALPFLATEIDTESREKLYNLYQSVLRSENISVQLHMPEGIPFDEICRAAAEMPIDLVVLGTHGTSGFREFFMGTTAYSVIKNTIKPVLTIPGGFSKDGFQNILFPVRAVPGIKEKFEYIQPLLQQTEAAAIHIAAISQNGHEAELLDHKDALHEIILHLKKSAVTFTHEMYTCSNFADKVLEIATMQAADLIVINATLDYKWTHFFIGPYTQQVVNHSKVPVLSFPQAVNSSSALKREAGSIHAVQSTAGL